MQTAIKHYIVLSHDEYIVLCNWAMKFINISDVDIITRVENGIVINTIHPRYFKAMLLKLATSDII